MSFAISFRVTRSLCAPSTFGAIALSKLQSQNYVAEEKPNHRLFDGNIVKRKSIQKSAATVSTDLAADRCPSGVEGLDDILAGGLPRDCFYLVQGDPGSGKTTLALQFLLEGARHGEAGLYVTLSETKNELATMSRSHGWSIDALSVCELMAAEDTLRPDAQYTLFHPSEVELATIMRTVFEDVERVGPVRAAFDSLSELRLLARDPLRFRRQVLGLKQFFAARHCTVLLLDDGEPAETGGELRSLVHGVVTLEQLAPLYGAERRRLRVAKLRGMRYRGGYHDFNIRTGGLEVFPRLVAAERREPYRPEAMTSGVPALDTLLGGGVERGTSTLILGPAGTGKSAVVTRCALLPWVKLSGTTRPCACFCSRSSPIADAAASA